ncbi:MAG TPA: Ig-like domain-containing protein, partial [bacterium]|nr:Ig-like domain-containing protein [bacterium]
MITVIGGAPDSIYEISSTSVSLTPTQTTTLKVKLTDDDGNGLQDSVVYWTIQTGSGALSLASDSTDELGVSQVVFTAPTTSGVSTVRAYITSLSTDSGRFTITTNPAVLAYYTIIPSTNNDTVGVAITATVTAYDIFNNTLDDDTTRVQFDVIGSVTGLNGSGVGINPTNDTLTNGQLTVVVTDSVKETLQIRVTSLLDTTKRTATNLITLRAAAPSIVEFYPDSLTNVQSGQFGQPLLDSLALVVKDQFGNTVNDTVTVQWFATSDGTASPVIRTTDNDGIARSLWTLRTGASSYDTMYAVIPVTGDSLQFIANLLPTGEDTLIRVSSLVNSDTVNQMLPDTFRVLVRDQFSNPVSNTAISFTAYSYPSGSDSTGFIRGAGNYVTTLDTVTDINGYASAIFHMGTKVGQYIIRASNPSLLNPAVFDTIQATFGLPGELRLLSGNAQTDTVDQIVDTLRVQVYDRYGNVVNDTARVIWEAINNSVSVLNQGLVDAVSIDSVSGTPTFRDSALAFTQGIAKANWRLKDLTGSDSVRAFIPGIDTVLFTATTVPDAPFAIIKTEGDSATVVPLGGLVTLKTRLEDQFGNVISGKYVRQNVLAGSVIFVGGDSAMSNAQGISLIELQLGGGDSATVQATTSGLVGGPIFTTYALRYVVGSLKPTIALADTEATFTAAFINYGPHPVALDSNQTRVRFSDGVTTFRSLLSYGDTVIRAHGQDTLQFRTDTIPSSFGGKQFNVRFDLRGQVASVSDTLYGTLETGANVLNILGVDVISVNTPAPKVYGRGDTITVQLQVYNSSNVTLTNLNYGLLTSKSGVFDLISSIDATPFAPRSTSVFNITAVVRASAPLGQIVVNGFYSGSNGGVGVSDTLANTMDTIIIQSDASLRYVAATLSPDTVSEGQSVAFRISVINDSLASVILDKANTYLRFGGDSTYLTSSQVVPGSGASTTLLFDPLTITNATSGRYQGVLVLNGTENGGLFDTTLFTGADSLTVQTTVTTASLEFDSVEIALDTTAQYRDSVALRVRIVNNAQASAVIDSIILDATRNLATISGYSVVGTGSLPDTIAGNSSSVFTLYALISSVADTGSIVFDGRIVAHDINSGNTVNLSPVTDKDSIFVRKRATLSIISVVSPSHDTVAVGQNNIPFVVTIANQGGSPATISDLQLVFKRGLYDTTLTQTLPDTLYGYETRAYNFTAHVLSNSATGLDSIGAYVSGSDQLNQRMISLTSTGRDTLLILSNSLIALNSVQTTPTLVSRGQDSILVRVSVTNLSSSVGRIDTIQLKFFDEAVSLLNTGFDVTPYSDLSDTVSGNTTKSFLFKVNIDAAADTGITTIDAVLKGRDEVSGTSVYDSLAVSADQWTIQIPAQLTVDSVWALPATVSQNQQNIPVNVVIRNTGVATARVDSVRLRYYYGSTLSTSDFVDSLTVPLGTITLVGGDSALYLFNTDALSSAASGTVRFYAVAFGQDNNSLQARVDTSRLRYDSVLVQTRPVLSYTANTLTPDTVTIGDAFNYRLDISNSGEANVILTPSTQLILRDVDSLKVNLQDTVFIASGYTRTLDFSTALIGLRIDSVYYPEVRFVGTENDNAFNAYLYITNDSVKILSPGLVSADSFGVYDKNGALSVNISAGDTFTVRLLVRNNGGARIENLAPQPGALSISGTTIPVLLSGPTPTTAILERQDSVRFQWTYRADSSGTVNLSVRAQGADAVTDSSVQSAQRNIFLTVQNAVADTLYALTLTTDTVQVYQFTDITVVARDTANRIAQADSVRFRVLTGTAGFRDTSRATIDTTIATDALGRATMRLFTGSIPSASLVRAYLRSTADDSVSFNIASVPRAVSSLQVAVNSSWTVGLNEAVTITALDQYGNVATNALSNVTLSGINTSSLQ